MSSILGCGDCILGSVGVEGRVWSREVLGQLVGSEMVVKNVEKNVFFEIDVFWSGFGLELIQCWYGAI